MPMPVGAAATAAGSLAFAAVSFMLDVGARVSPLVIREMLVTVLLNALLAIPVFAFVPPRAAARRSRSIRSSCGRRRRPRAQTGPLGLRGPRDLMYLDNDRRPALTPQLAVRVAIIGGIALVRVRGHLLPPLVPPGALGRQVPGRGQRQPRARDQGPGAARRDRGPRRDACWWTTAPALAVVITPDKLPDDDADAPARSTGASASCSACARGRSGATCEPQLKALPFSPATVKQDVAPTSSSYYLLEHQDEFPGVDVERVFLRKYPHHEIGAHLFGTVGEMTEEQQKDPRYRGVDLGDRVGPVGDRAPVRPLPARQATAPAGSRWTRSGNLQAASSRSERAGAGPPAAPVGGPRRAGGGPGRRSRAAPGAAPSRSWTCTTARCSALGSQPVVRPEHLRQGHQDRRPGSASTTRTTARRSPTARSRAAIPPARRSS